MKSYNICVIKGDGIGPEIAEEAIKVLDSVSAKFNFKLNYEYFLMGGAIGGEKWDNLPRHLRPESGLLKLRKSLEAYANLRPAMIYDELINASTLKPEVIKGVDILVVRELTGGLYFGQPREKLEDRAYNTMAYTVEEIERIAKIAFDAAMKRRKKVCLVDKANVLETSQLWREITAKVAKDYPEVSLEYMYVDNAAMQLVRYPTGFDVILTENLFGDILSDEASMVCGSIGLLPSASIGGSVGIYEPIHGSAPDIAGQGIANPIAMILSAAMMLRYALSENEAANCIENAIKAVLKDGYRTKDIAKFDAVEICTTSEIGSIISDYIKKQ